MIITIFGKKVNINSDLIKAYESLGNIMNADQFIHLATTSGTDKNSNPKELKEAIELSIKETLELEKKMPDIINRIKTDDAK